jgi:hypothetical protein
MSGEAGEEVGLGEGKGHDADYDAMMSAPAPFQPPAPDPEFVGSDDDINGGADIDGEAGGEHIGGDAGGIPLDDGPVPHPEGPPPPAAPEEDLPPPPEEDDLPPPPAPAPAAAAALNGASSDNDDSDGNNDAVSEHGSANASAHGSRRNTDDSKIVHTALANGKIQDPGDFDSEANVLRVIVSGGSGVGDNDVGSIDDMMAEAAGADAAGLMVPGPPSLPPSEPTSPHDLDSGLNSGSRTPPANMPSIDVNAARDFSFNQRALTDRTMALSRRGSNADGLDALKQNLETQVKLDQLMGEQAKITETLKRLSDDAMRRQTLSEQKMKRISQSTDELIERLQQEVRERKENQSLVQTQQADMQQLHAAYAASEKRQLITEQLLQEQMKLVVVLKKQADEAGSRHSANTDASNDSTLQAELAEAHQKAQDASAKLQQQLDEMRRQTLENRELQQASAKSQRDLISMMNPQSPLVAGSSVTYDWVSPVADKPDPDARSPIDNTAASFDANSTHIGGEMDDDEDDRICRACAQCSIM